MGDLSFLNVYYVNNEYKIWQEKCGDYCMKVFRVKLQARQKADTAESPVYEAVETEKTFVGFMDITPDMIGSGSKEALPLIRISKDAVLQYAESYEDNPRLVRLGYDQISFSMICQPPNDKITLRREHGVTVDQLLFYLVKKAEINT